MKSPKWCQHDEIRKDCPYCRIEELEEWIREEGERSNVCTRPILKKVCDGCKCGRAR